MEAGTIAPWFNMPGGGIQYKLTQSVQWYKDMGYLEEVIIINK